MSKVNAGKRFEGKIRKSLELKGYVQRIQDKMFMGQNGFPLSRQSEGDFWHFTGDGHGFLIECKATKLKSFPFDKLRPEQERELLRFDDVADNFHGVVALNFYAENLRERNRCFVLAIQDYMAYKDTCGRASMPLDAAEGLGIECPRIKGGLWDVGLGHLCG
ncbi:MAG: hypothetical protein RSG23_04995 [Gordonibacter sp.]|uniref:hypothetical protein n=1 Tax=Gordonibacter sp. TaxID=1968902 RepID=UPI002FCBFDC1